MPKVSDVYSSAGLKADEDVPDLEDDGLVVTIKGSRFRDFDDGGKIILEFRETDKSLVLNKTNADTCVKMFGSDDTDDWIGRKIKLYSTDTTFKGKPTRGIRIYSRPVKSPPRPAPGGEDFDEFDPPPQGRDPKEAAAEAMDV